MIITMTLINNSIMGNYEDLKNAIASVIKNNGNGEITGDLLQETLLSMVSNLGQYATFAGIAKTTTNPGTPDQKVFYIAAEKGVYVNFNAIEVEENQLVILTNGTGEWSKQVITSISGGGTSGGNSGLKYSEERTLYVSYEGEELTEEQKAYNAETYNKISEGHTVTINYEGMFLTIPGIFPSDKGESIMLSTIVAVPNAVIPVTFMLYADGTVSMYEAGGEDIEISNQLYVPAPGATLSENAKENNKKVRNVRNISYITVVAPSGGVYGIEAKPIGLDVGDKVFFFCYAEMYKATVDFTTGEVETEIYGTLNTSL